MSIIFLCLLHTVFSSYYQQEDLNYKNKAKEMFDHAFSGYMNYAYPQDELKPLSCDGMSSWGNYSLTLIDSLDTLVIMGKYDEFKDSYKKVLQNVRFDIDKNVSVFETNIRVVGGLLSAHLLMQRAGVEPLPEGWPCSGPLLDLAVDIASRLLPAFATPTGLPYGSINLLYGVPVGETTVTGTASAGTYIMEFGVLSRLTGDPSYEHAARRALQALYHARSSLNLVGNHIDITLAEWIYKEAGIGGNIDSYYEYLLKGGLFFNDKKLLEQFKTLYKSVIRYMQHDYWYIWVNMFTGMPSMPSVSTLDAFWPSLQILIGDTKSAGKTLLNFYSLISHYGFTPELFSLIRGQVQQGSEIYPLRPEFVESLVYMYRATGDPIWRNMGKQVIDSIEASAKTTCGYATVGNVVTHQLEDKMESFFLSETTKYLYLLFSDDHHWIFDKRLTDKTNVTVDEHGEYRICAPNSFGYIFTTEAHPLPVGVLDCCFSAKDNDVRYRGDFFRNTVYKKYVESRDKASLYLNNLPETFLPASYYFPALPALLSADLSRCYLIDRFLITVARSHKNCLAVQFKSVSTNEHVQHEQHNCKVRKWYEKFEVNAVDLVKVPTKKAFRVVNNK